MAKRGVSGTRVHALRVPGDKSLTHRALLFSALADGTSRLSGLLPGDDPHSSASALRALGSTVPPLDSLGGEIIVRGRGLRGFSPPASEIDCGNSGTTTRLLMGILSAQAFAATLTGDASLRSRPMRRVTEPLTRMGARFEELGEADRLPIRVHGGPLTGIEHANSKASAQVKSAVLLAGLVGGVSVTVTEPVLSRDHSERMLIAQGVRIVTSVAQDVRVTLEPADRLAPLDFEVPGDFSSAAYLLAYGALTPNTEIRIAGVGVNRTRTGFLDVLERMGADVELSDVHDRSGEPVAELIVRSAHLRGATVLAHEIPRLVDEVPIIAVLAARARGETRITGAGELRVKESDRLAAIASNLRAIGAAVEELPDGLVIQGSERPLEGSIQTFADHRIAMAFGVLGSLAGNRIEIDDRACVGVSYPDFWSTLASLE
jgi:3-phosphoshikimate 1-carboxyvinyltransferase